LVLAHEFARAGFGVEFVLMQSRGELLEEVRASFSVIDLAAPRARAVPFALARYLRQSRPDALLAAMWPLTVIAPLAQRLSGHCCKVVVSEHGILSAQYRDWGRAHHSLLRISTGLGYRLAHRCVGVSAGVAADISVLSAVRRELFEVIYNPVPQPPALERAALEAAENLWSVPSGARILTVGTMKAVKNHPLLLRAFARLARPDAQLMFVGDGAGRDDLISLAHELGVTDQVVFAGFHRDPTPFYRTADLFVLSSDHEGFGNVIVEAMVCGTPVVSTDCPSGPGEILESGKYGRLVRVGDIAAMANAIEMALEDSLPEKVLRKRASDFEPKHAASAYLNLMGLI
jgi:glycosyltransferase involved in cell wall biosynthesis